MKLKKRKTSKVWKEVFDTIEAFKDNPDYAPDPDHVQIYITTRMVVLLNFILDMMENNESSTKWKIPKEGFY